MKRNIFLALFFVGSSFCGSLNDDITTVSEMKKILAVFNKAREWDKTNTPKDLSMALAIEASELMEVFLRMTDMESKNVMDSKEWR